MGERVAEVHVAWARPVAGSRLPELLDERERGRAASLRHLPDRTRYIAAHALLRLVIAEHTGAAAAGIVVTSTCPTCGGPHGQPRLVEPAGYLISLSYQADRLLAAITAAGEIGVDVERHSATDFDGFAEVALAATERAALSALPTATRSAAAATWWARKEAILKATGHGLRIAPSDLVVSAPDEPARLLSWPVGPPPALRLSDLDLGDGYSGAVAVLTGGRPRLNVSDANGLLAAWAAPSRTAIRRAAPA